MLDGGRKKASPNQCNQGEFASAAAASIYSYSSYSLCPHFFVFSSSAGRVSIFQPTNRPRANLFTLLSACQPVCLSVSLSLFCMRTYTESEEGFSFFHTFIFPFSPLPIASGLQEKREREKEKKEKWRKMGNPLR